MPLKIKFTKPMFFSALLLDRQGDKSCEGVTVIHSLTEALPLIKCVKGRVSAGDQVSFSAR